MVLPLRLLHVLAPARVGGLERVVLSLAAGHLARGHDVRAALVVTPATRDVPLADALTDAGVGVEVLRVDGRDYRLERRLVAAIRHGQRTQVVHTHGYRPDVLHGALAPAPRVARVSTVHGFTGGSRRNRLNEWMQERALGRLDAVVAVADPIAARLSAAGVAPDRLHVRRNALAVPTEPLSRSAARAAMGLPERAWLVGWVGRLSHEKGADLLPELAAALPKDVALVAIGDGPRRDAVQERAAALGVANRLHLVGTRLDAAALLPAFDAWCLTSHTEGTPIALLEAMAAGVPVVATSVGGVPHVLGTDAGWLVPPGDAAALAGALVECRRDPAEAARRAASARARVDGEFAPEPWLDWYESLYQRLALVGEPARSPLTSSAPARVGHAPGLPLGQ